MQAKQCALKIVHTLNGAGYIAYFAGGWVRDLLMTHPSDDIDIATDAPPEVIIELFPRTILVGLSFGVVIVVMDGHQFEVATFRRDIEYTGGRKPDKIELSTPQEDADRRDFTINGMFYDPLKDEIIDFVGGRKDLERGIIRTIGSPHERFVEDRLRMIRAIRFASRFNFSIAEETRKAIQDNAHTLFPAVAMERIWQEFNKMAKAPRFDRAILELHHLGLLSIIFPGLQQIDAQTLQARVANFEQFPQNTPVVLYLLDLFPDLPLDELLEICQYLKMSGYEGKLIEYAYKGKILLKQAEVAPETITSEDWVHFYSNRYFKECFAALTAHYPEIQRTYILTGHQQRHERLLPHIQRAVERKPVVTAAILQDFGIPPGKRMGQLLKEAEKIAIINDLHDVASIMPLLMQTTLWPKGERDD